MLVAVWLVTALAFNAPTLASQRTEQWERDGIEQQSLLFRPLQFVPYCAGLLLVHIEG